MEKLSLGLDQVDSASGVAINRVIDRRLPHKLRNVNEPDLFF